MVRSFSMLLFFSVAACSPQTSSPQNNLATRGRSIYMAQCISCHAADPSQDGPVGPAVSGASRELLEARLLHRSYPPGYPPKRTTQIMQSFPHLEKEIPALEAFLVKR
ncbi:MAG: cytochrome c [Deltaproteobacteria bacterium]|nr:cytochrome c [Deltaproteobacteria bacterium]